MRTVAEYLGDARCQFPKIKKGEKPMCDHSYRRTSNTRYWYSWKCSRCNRTVGNAEGRRPSPSGCPSAPATVPNPGEHLWGSETKKSQAEEQCVKCNDTRWRDTL